VLKWPSSGMLRHISCQILTDVSDELTAANLALMIEARSPSETTVNIH
jgi:hypothetical protein